MKIITTKTINSFDGKPLKIDKDGGAFTMAFALSEILLSTKVVAGKMKLYNLAEKIYKEEEVEVDVSDLSLIKKAVEASEGYNNLILGQILVYLEELK